MGFWDRILGRSEQPGQQAPPIPRAGGRPSAPTGRSEDEVAVERYRYLLRTAPPDTIEQVHLEAFSKLSPEQRTLLFEQLRANAPEGEGPADDRPATLARSATRSEMRQPGTLERAYQGGDRGGMGGGGMGMGGMIAGSLLGTVAGVVVGSAIAQAFLPDSFAGTGADAAGADGGDAGADGGDAGAEASGDYGSGGDAGGGDYGSGDFGGGDLGGGDFGGGDFGGF